MMVIKPWDFLSVASLLSSHKALWGSVTHICEKPKKATCQIIVKQIPAAEYNQAAFSSS